MSHQEILNYGHHNIILSKVLLEHQLENLPKALYTWADSVGVCLISGESVC